MSRRELHSRTALRDSLAIQAGGEGEGANQSSIVTGTLIALSVIGMTPKCLARWLLSDPIPSQRREGEAPPASIVIGYEV